MYDTHCWHRVPVSQGRWETLEGTFTLSSMPDRVVFYLEGPSAGAELLIKSVSITCPSSTVREEIMLSLITSNQRCLNHLTQVLHCILTIFVESWHFEMSVHL